MSTTLSFSEIKEYLPLLIPLAVLQLSLMMSAVISILKHNAYKHGNRAVWLIVSLCISIIGPVLYFTLGKEEE